MASKEVKMFNEMMELIQDSCRSFNEFKDEARRIVLRTKSFADNTIEYTTDAQDDNLKLRDTDGLLEDWRDSNKKMEVCIKKADTAMGLFNACFEKLRKAQGKAVEGQVCGMEKSWESLKTSAMCNGGAGAMACLGAAASGGLAFTFLAGGYLLTGGSLMSIFNAGKHEEWAKKFANIEWKLEQVYSVIRKQTDAMKKELIYLHHESGEILDKASRIANRSRLSRSEYFKLKCRRLGQQSNGLKTGCDQYISHEDDFAITGPMAQLKLDT